MDILQVIWGAIGGFVMNFLKGQLLDYVIGLVLTLLVPIVAVYVVKIVKVVLDKITIGALQDYAYMYVAAAEKKFPDEKSGATIRFPWVETQLKRIPWLSAKHIEKIQAAIEAACFKTDTELKKLLAERKNPTPPTTG